MVPECFVDGDVVDWQAEEDDPVGCDLSAVVVYHPAIGRKAFVTGCDWLEDRADARVDAILTAAARRGRDGLSLIDTETLAEADSVVDRRFGSSFLSTFVNDTAMVAHHRIGEAFEKAESLGAKLSPDTASGALQITPAKSFRSSKALQSYLMDAKMTWKPSVRLLLTVSIDGPFSAVEEAAWVIRSALTACGPVTEWRQRVRTCKPDAASYAGRKLRVVTG